MRRPARKQPKRKLHRTKRAEDERAVRRSQEKSKGLQVTGIRGQKMKALGKGSVSTEGLVLLFFLCFFDGVKYQNHIAIHDGSIYNRESKLENNRKQ